jgi:chaperone modulatory protein CbpM
MDDREFCLHLKIEVAELDFWIEQGWLSPASLKGQRRFRDIDLARAALIFDLTRRMGVNEAGIDIVMDLVDQLYGIRRTMRDLISIINQEDAAVQRRLLAALDKLYDS